LQEVFAGRGMLGLELLQLAWKASEAFWLTPLPRRCAAPLDRQPNA